MVQRNIIVGEAVCSGEGTVTYVGPPGVGTAGALEHMDEEYLARWQGRFKEAKRYTVPCKPIGAMIRAAGVGHVDFFSLDVEGAELTVLSTMDWSITVGVWIIEMSKVKEKQMQIIALLRKHGYVRHRIKGADVFIPVDSVPYVQERKAFCSRCVKDGIAHQIERLEQLRGEPRG